MCTFRYYYYRVMSVFNKHVGNYDLSRTIFLPGGLSSVDFVLKYCLIFNNRLPCKISYGGSDIAAQYYRVIVSTQVTNKH